MIKSRRLRTASAHSPSQQERKSVNPGKAGLQMDDTPQYLPVLPVSDFSHEKTEEQKNFQAAMTLLNIKL